MTYIQYIAQSCRKEKKKNIIYKPHSNNIDQLYNIVTFFVDCMTLEDGTDRVSRNLGNELPIYAV